jgi:hypothetical protein
MTVTEKQAPMALAGSALDHCRHVCVFYNNPDEEYRVLLQFIKEGHEKGHKTFHIIDSRNRADHLRRLRELGIDVEVDERTGKLEVRGWENAHFHPGHFDQQAMLALVEEVLTEARQRGFPFTRWVANMNWALEDRPGVEDLAEYCARLNFVVPRYDAAIV